jgi:hypothetical protein
VCDSSAIRFWSLQQLLQAPLCLWTRNVSDDLNVLSNLRSHTESNMRQSHVAIIAIDQAYGSSTMIGDNAKSGSGLLAKALEREESYISATFNLKRIRQTRSTSRHFQQRRPDLYGTLVAPKNLLTPAGVQHFDGR